jgi:mRNA-degrading endonuclease RelE of RelBE toxin-antitoxin system
VIVLALHPDAQADLDGLAPRDKALLMVCLEELESDPDLADNLLDDGYDETGAGTYGPKKWIRFYRQGIDIWRLRLWKAEAAGLNYRVFYAYLPKQLRFYVLAIVPRNQVDYDDPSHHLAIRIRAAFDAL